MNIICFILISLFWGGSFLAIKYSLTGFSPFLAATLRVLVAWAITLVCILWKKQKFPEKKIVVKMLINGAVGVGLAWVFLFWGEQYVAPAICSVLNATSPIFTMIFAVIILSSNEERMTWNKWLGVVLGFAGIAVIFGPFISSRSMHSIEGFIAIIGMSICYGISIAWLKKLTPHLTNLIALFLECTGALIVLIPITIVFGFTDYALTGKSMILPILGILYLGIFSTVIAFILFYKLVRDVGAVNAAAVTYMVPIISILLDLIILGKWIGNHALFGTLIVFAALRTINRPVKAYID